jgi:hypothetical protein
MKRETLNYTDNKGLKIFAQTILNNKARYVHEIKNLVISKQMDFYAVVNRETLKINSFDIEEDAVNYALDFYKNLALEQSKLFN